MEKVWSELTFDLREVLLSVHHTKRLRLVRKYGPSDLLRAREEEDDGDEVQEHISIKHPSIRPAMTVVATTTSQRMHTVYGKSKCVLLLFRVIQNGNSCRLPILTGLS